MILNLYYLFQLYFSDHGFETVDTTVKGEDAISLARYVNQSYVKFQFNYGPLGLIDTNSADAQYVAEELKSETCQNFLPSIPIEKFFPNVNLRFVIITDSNGRILKANLS